MTIPRPYIENESELDHRITVKALGPIGFAQAWTDQEAVDKCLPQRYRVPKPSSPFDWLNPPPLDHTLIMQVWGFELSLLSVDGQPFWAYKLIH